MAQIPTRKLETGVAVFAIILVLALCLALSHQSKEDAASLIALDANETDLKSLQKTVKDLETQTSTINDQLTKVKGDLAENANDIEQNAKDMIDPGPEPYWLFHPFKHSAWTTLKTLHDKAGEEKQELLLKKQQLETDINNLTQQAGRIDPAVLKQKKADLDKMQQIVTREKQLVGFGEWLWDVLIRRILHFCLLLTLILLVPRIALRLILINGWTKTYRV